MFRMFARGVVVIAVLVCGGSMVSAQGFVTNAFREPVDGIVAATSDATPTVIGSIGASGALYAPGAVNPTPVGDEKVSFVDVFVVAVRGDWAAGFAGGGSALFAKRTGSTLVRVGAGPSSVLVNTLGLQAGAVVATANAATGLIDITVTGLAATNIEWWFSIHVRETQ